MITLNNIQEAFASLTPEQQEYVLDSIPSVPEQYMYYRTHWFFGDEDESKSRERAISDVYSWYTSIKNNTYGLQD